MPHYPVRYLEEIVQSVLWSWFLKLTNNPSQNTELSLR